LWRLESCWKDIPKFRVGDVLADRQQVICGTDEQGSNGCGTKWFTLEIVEIRVWVQAGREPKLLKRGVLRLILAMKGGQIRALKVLGHKKLAMPLENRPISGPLVFSSLP